MTIQVELIDGAICRVAPRGLDLLLGHCRVKRFRRTSGWVVVGSDPIRTKPAGPAYRGPERRLYI